MKKFLLCLPFLLAFTNCTKEQTWQNKTSVVLEQQILEDAEWAMQQSPETITSKSCERSEGGINDFYSEGDYWWPNPEDPDGPYIRRDGETNPENFVDHRLLMIRFSKIVGSLGSAYIHTNDEKYAAKAFEHVRAWFVNPETMMNPNLLYAQAIKGIVSGRGIGIIDTIHLMEVAQGIKRMQQASTVDKQELEVIKQWFNDYITWLTTHPYGLKEMEAKNNHGTCWVMQVASFASLTENEEVLTMCRDRYKTVLLPNQMGENGSFPLEMSRTKPYGYALFNLDAMATVCQILSTEKDNLWTYTSDAGLSIKDGVEFMFPYIQDKSMWPYQQDVMYWDEWPVAQPSLLFAAVNYDEPSYFQLWKSLKHKLDVQEVVRNMPIRNPLIWL